MDCTILINFVLLATFGSETAGKLIMKPRDTDVKVNHSTYFNCSSDIGPTDIFWFHGTKYVYTGAILDPYRDRFEIDRDVSNGTYIYNLVIHFVQPGDAGEYICAEDEGVREKYSVKLVVLDDDPICRSNMELDEVIGQNTCNIEPDEVELECSVTYHGNIPPQMEWKKVGENSSTSLEVSVVTYGNLYVSALKLRGDRVLNNSSYVCETKRTTEEPNKCSSKVIKILYALNDNSTVNKTIDDEIHCKANTSLSCNYKWRWLQDNDLPTESYTSVLKATKPGWHRCEAECYLRNRTCILLVMRAMVYGGKGESSQTRTIIIAVVVTVVVTLVVVGVLICVFLLWIARDKDKAPGENEGSNRNELSQFDIDDRFQDDIDERFQDDSDSFEEDCMPLGARPREPLPAINGVAILGQDLFISRLQSPDVDVYDSTTFRLRRKIKVEGMANAEHIVSCSVNICLYAIDVWLDNPDPAIQRIKPTDGTLIKTWNVPEGGDRLSIASDTNVILNINHEAKLHEYTSEGILLRKIHLAPGTGITQSCHAVKLPHSGLFAVCHSDYGDLLSRVCLLSIKATTKISEKFDEVEVQILETFGSEQEESIYRLKKPTYLSVDMEGSILVSDEAKMQAVLLGPNLENPRILVSEEHGLDLPWRTGFDELTCQWFVADHRHVIVCRVKDDQVERQLHDLSRRSLRYPF